jgi:hypothetical protein
MRGVDAKVAMDEKKERGGRDRKPNIEGASFFLDKLPSVFYCGIYCCVSRKSLEAQSQVDSVLRARAAAARSITVDGYLTTITLPISTSSFTTSPLMVTSPLSLFSSLPHLLRHHGKSVTPHPRC